MSERREDKLGLFGLIALLVFMSFLAFLAWKSSRESIIPTISSERLQKAIRYIETKEQV